jgi:2-methylcitrate dehydratase PrpD
MARPAREIHSLPQTGVTVALAQAASGLRLEDLSPELRTVARHCLLDWLGVGLAGSREPVSRLLVEEILADGGRARATVLGQRRRVAPQQAALANGTLAHALDYDDVHFAMPGHPTVAVAPGVMALAEAEGHTGAEAVTAFLAGVETACRVGRYLGDAHYDAGFHATGTVGAFGSAAACSRLLGLDAERTATAMAIAATGAAGLKSLFGTMCKPLHAGRAAAAGLQGALLARRGFTARGDILETVQGFADTHAGVADAEAALDGLGREFLARGVLFKYHASCYGTHATIDALASLRGEHGLTPAGIASVEVRVPPAYLRVCDIVEPATGLEAKFSLRLCASLALTGVDTAAIATWSDALAARPELTALAARVQIEGDLQLGHGQSRVSVTRRDGGVFRARADASRPDPDLERQGRRIEAKFLSLAEPVVGSRRARRLVAGTARIESLATVAGLLAGTRAAREPANDV